jgi:ATP-binding cassette subfamily F protein 3
LRLEHSPLWHLKRLDPAAREQGLRNFLGGFDFRGKQAESAIAPFSGGEKARLALALIVYQRPNLLLLDEPTNHLDIEMREALTEALLEFEGALVVIAHDRHLLRATVDELWLVANGGLAPFDGDLDDYRDWVLDQRRRERNEPVADPAAAPADRKAQKREEAAARQRLADTRRPLLARQSAVEKQMAVLTAEREQLDAWLATPVAYTEAMRDDLKVRVARQGELSWQLARLETEWLELAEALEKFVA